MVVDYVRRTRTPAPPPKRSRKGLTIFIIAIAVILPATMFLVSFHHQKKSASTAQPLAIQTPTIKPTKKVIAPSAARTNASQYDFYSLLPKMEVVVPTTEESALALGNTTAGNRYLVQVASLQNVDDAERMRDRLGELGVLTTVQTYRTIDGAEWHRLIAGPFNLSDAERQQSLLHQHDIDSLLLKMK